MKNYDLYITSAGFGAWTVTAYYTPTGRAYKATTRDSLSIDAYKSEDEGRKDEGKAALLSAALEAAYTVTTEASGRAAVTDTEKGYTFYFTAGRFYDPLAPMHEIAVPNGAVDPEVITEAEEEAVAFLQALRPEVVGPEADSYPLNKQAAENK